MEAVGKSGEVDLGADGDAGQDPIPYGGFGSVSVDVDHDQASGAAGDPDAELRVLPPPVLNPVLVEGG